MPEETSTVGRPRKVSDAELKRLVGEIAAAERVATTTDIEERVRRVSRRTLQKRLRDLYTHGEIASKEVGATGRVYWLPNQTETTTTTPATEAERQYTTAAETETDETSGGRDAVETDPEPAGARDRRDGTSDDGDGWPPDSDVDTQIEALELSGSADSDEGRAAIRALYDYIVEEGEAQKQDFLEDVYPDHGMDLTEAGWWNAVGKDTERLGEGFKTLVDRRDDLLPPKGGNHRDYRYVGGE